MSHPRQKGTHDKPVFACRSRKRKFHGKQFVQNEEEEASEQNTSASDRKISSALNEAVIHPTISYRIIDFVSVFFTLSQYLICSKCKAQPRFQESAPLGLGFNIIMSCRCDNTIIPSGPKIHSGFEINRRIVFVMRLLGIGLEGINTFCNYMDICKGLSKTAYEKTIKKVHEAGKKVFDASCSSAIESEKTENEKKGKPADELDVSGDGSWKRRGYQSLLGVVTLIANSCGKVIDLVVKSSCCKACTTKKNVDRDSEEYAEWWAEHEEECSKNHQGSAGS